MSEKSPEARLLELIKGGSRPPAAEGRRWGGALLALGRRLASRWGSLTPWQAANRAAALALAAAAAWTFRGWRLAPPVDAEVAAAAGPEAREDAGRGLSLGDLTRRNLFRPLVAPPPPPAAAPPPTPPPAPRIPLSQRTAHLRLTGVLGGEPPQAVVEDRRRSVTRYVAAGDALEEFRVEKVLSDRVVLSADGETVELVL